MLQGTCTPINPTRMHRVHSTPVGTLKHVTPLLKYKTEPGKQNGAVGYINENRGTRSELCTLSRGHKLFDFKGGRSRVSEKDW